MQGSRGSWSSAIVNGQREDDSRTLLVCQLQLDKAITFPLLLGLGYRFK